MNPSSLLQQLKGNVVQYRGRSLLLAGRHQFKTLWFRDASFALLTLLEGCQADGDVHSFARAHAVALVDTYLEHLDKETGFGPKCLDVMNPELRTVETSMFPCMDCGTSYQDDKEPVVMYQDSRGSWAVDGNLLVSLLCLELGYRIEDCQVLLKSFDEFSSRYGLITQGPYADWQDSVDRSPYSFHINLLYWRTLVKRNLPVEATRARLLMVAAFYDHATGLYAAIHRSGEKNKKKIHACLEDHLFALDWNFEGEGGKSLFATLQAHPLWRKHCVPGFPTHPPYERPAHWQARLGGLDHYHDSLYWSWTTAFAGIIAQRFGDVTTAGKIKDLMKRAIHRDGAVAEVYVLLEEDGKLGCDLKPFSSPTYQSERPWTWGVAYALRFAVGTQVS